MDMTQTLSTLGRLYTLLHQQILFSFSFLKNIHFLVLNALVHPPASMPSGGDGPECTLVLLPPLPAPVGAGSASHILWIKLALLLSSIQHKGFLFSPRLLVATAAEIVNYSN